MEAKKKYTIFYITENKYEEWTVEDILEYINADRSEHWTDYNETDWEEGWDFWAEGEFYKLIK